MSKRSRRDNAATPALTAAAPRHTAFVHTQSPEAVGITCFRSGKPLVSGRVKSRYADFLVNEIGIDGTCLRLGYPTLGGLPPSATPVVRDDTAADALADSAMAATATTASAVAQASDGDAEPRLKADALDELRTLLVQAGHDAAALQTTLLQIEVLLAYEAAHRSSDRNVESNASSPPPPPPPAVIPVTGLDKAARKAIHTFFKVTLANRLCSETNEGQLCLRIWGAGEKAQSRRRNARPSGTDWARRGGEYLHFNLFKENKDTFEANTIITRLLGLRTGASSVTFAGTKDKRGVTVQRACLRCVDHERLATVNQRLQGIRLGTFAYAKEPLRLGQLKGNRFTIIVRQIQPTAAAATLAGDALRAALQKRVIDEFAEKGFVNYFGMQRFGTRDIGTHQAGILMLAGQWQETINLIMAPKSGESATITAARAQWAEHHDAKAALAMGFSSLYGSAERALLQWYARHPELRHDPHAALFSALPRNLRTMYLHAYQSWIWNQIVSIRLDRYGPTARKGDLVLVDPAVDDVDDELVSAVDAASAAPKEDADAVPRVAVRALTAEEAAQTSMFDVVVPKPGWNVTYPDFLLPHYQSLMAQHQLDPLDMRRKWHECSLPGDYRHVLGRPRDVTVAFQRYTDPQRPLVPTDLDQITEAPTKFRAAPAPFQALPDVGPYDALILGFTLGTSQYATVALREIVEADQV